jgi:hypothetical protein
MHNCFYAEGDFLFFDQEWVYDNLPAEYIIFRTLRLTYAENPFLEELCPIQYWQIQYNLESVWSFYILLENSMIVEKIFCKDFQIIAGKLAWVAPETVYKNITLLRTGHDRLRQADIQYHGLQEQYHGLLNSKSFKTMILLRNIAKKTGILFILREILLIRRKLRKK